jgi:hypothetical protein
VVDRDQGLLGAGLDLLDGPGVAVRIAEAEERPTVALVEDRDLAAFDAAIGQLLAGRLGIGDDQRASSRAPSRSAMAGRRSRSSSPTLAALAARRA